MKELKFKQFDISEINEITLLSVEEARKVPVSILACGKWWWLRSPGYIQERAAKVGLDGNVLEHGYFVNYEHTAVRPAFRINNLESKIGEPVRIGKTWCTVIDKGLVLADKLICNHRFDKKSNNWETSELKAFVNSDKFKAMI